MAIDPFIPLFRAYRDQLLLRDTSLSIDNPRPNVLDDYYFSTNKLASMKALRRADPDVAFDIRQWPQLKRDLESRMSLASSNLIPHLDYLPSSTFRQVFTRALDIIHSASGAPSDVQWVGFNDNWTAEFFPLLAQLFPEAKFVLNLRDPRSVLHASEFGEPNPTKRPTVLSFARHLRKNFAFAIELQNEFKLEERLLISQYEDAIRNPTQEARRLTSFLGVEFEEDMVCVDKFRKADGSPWQTPWAVYQNSIEPWRDCDVPSQLVELTEFVCQYEMQLFGYEVEFYDPTHGLSDDTLEYAMRNTAECLGWRTDFPEVERTLGSEMFRHSVVRAGQKLPAELVERLFLFPSVFDAISSHSA